jgi:hypothetical protein
MIITKYNFARLGALGVGQIITRKGRQGAQKNA